MTTLLAAVVTRTIWRWPLWRTCIAVSGFLVVDVVFFAANTVKLASGGWLPLLMGVVVFFLMATWRRGREQVGARIAKAGVPLIPYLAHLSQDAPSNRPGRTAVFLSASPRTVPRALLANLEHNELLHARTIILYVDQVDVPRVAEEDRVHVERLPADCVRVTLRTGFLDRPDVPWALARSAELGLDVDPATVSYFLGRDAILVGDAGARGVRKRIFAVLHRSAGSSVGFFNLPPGQVIEIGSQVVI
jgi:KUP system potassium uptake protein